MEQLAAQSGISGHAIWEMETQGSGTIRSLMAVAAALDLRFAGLPRGATLPDRVRTLRERAGISPEALAKRAGISPNAVRRMETGAAHVTTLEAVLDVLAPQARVRKPERAAWAGGSRDCRFTPPEVLAAIERVIGPIDLDPTGHPDSPVVAATRYCEVDDGLAQPWQGTVYCNPPYSGAAAFLRRAHRAWSTGECKVALLLLPVVTHTVTFHEAAVGQADIFFLKGRIAFLSAEGRRDRAPFGSMIVLFGADERMVERQLAAFDCLHVPKTVAVGHN